MSGWKLGNIQMVDRSRKDENACIRLETRYFGPFWVLGGDQKMHQNSRATLFDLPKRTRNLSFTGT